jgi:hypothetical protein
VRLVFFASFFCLQKKEVYFFGSFFLQGKKEQASTGKNHQEQKRFRYRKDKRRKKQLTINREQITVVRAGRILRRELPHKNLVSPPSGGDTKNKKTFRVLRGG